MQPPANRSVSCVLVGFGRVNRLVHAMQATTPWLDVAGVVVRPESRLAGLPVPAPVVGGHDLVAELDVESVLARIRPDVAIVATRPTLSEVMPTLAVAARHARLVLCTAEELAWVELETIAMEQLNDIAKQTGAAILPVGVNPGFLFDQWPLAAMGIVSRVDRLHVGRVVDAASFPAGSREHLGIGIEAATFDRGRRDGSIVGHIGFRESLRIIGTRLGIDTGEPKLDIAPLWAAHDIELDGATIPAGWTAGIEQSATATARDGTTVDLRLTFHVDSAAHGLEPGDEIRIDGDPPLRIIVPGGIRPGPATAALAVNSIGIGLAAGPGYHPSGTLRLPAPWLSTTAPVGVGIVPIWSPDARTRQDRRRTGPRAGDGAGTAHRGQRRAHPCQEDRHLRHGPAHRLVGPVGGEDDRAAARGGT